MTDASQRFWAKVSDPDAQGCRLWVGYRNEKGYGRFGVDRRLVLAHRFAYEEARGAIPLGLVLDHLCRNPACVTVSHLEAVTSGENTRRGRTGAAQRERTHCPQGHAYDEENTYVYRDGRRECRECRRIKHRRMSTERKGQACAR